ncbi:MAG: HNH endonuclease [Microbacteriaceae bacterium]|nr:MAG: HNH endonuclease [Microbacteriaceae bacterium]
MTEATTQTVDTEFAVLLRAEGWPSGIEVGGIEVGGIGADDFGIDDPFPEPPADFALPGPVVSGGDADRMIRTVDLEDRLELIVHDLEDVDQRIAALQARRSELLALADDWAELAVDVMVCPGDPEDYRREMCHRSVTAEIACALRIPEQTIAAQIDSAVALRSFPNTLAALWAGRISLRHADVIVDNCESLPSQSRAELEAALLPIAADTTAARLKRKARVLRERMHPDSMAKRKAAARLDRRLEFQPDRDGMAWLNHYLPAGDALQIYEATSSLASEAVTARDPRTMAQLRSDILTGLILDGDHAHYACAAGEPGAADEAADRATEAIKGNGNARSRSLRARPTVHVTVPVLTLLGASDEPAMLDGYGPIDPEAARALAAQAPSFTRILTHPVTGTVLDIDRTRYCVPADLRRWLQVRDETCRFPGCNRRAGHSDLDHTKAWNDGGTTCALNLEHLCRRHHVMKHKCSWKVTRAPDGCLDWVSPTGRTYRTAPAVVIGPAPAPEPPPESPPDARPDEADAQPGEANGQYE